MVPARSLETQLDVRKRITTLPAGPPWRRGFAAGTIARWVETLPEWNPTPSLSSNSSWASNSLVFNETKRALEATGCPMLAQDLRWLFLASHRAVLKRFIQ